MFHKMAAAASTDPQSWSEPECVAAYPYYGQGACPIACWFYPPQVHARALVRDERRGGGAARGVAEVAYFCMP